MVDPWKLYIDSPLTVSLGTYGGSLDEGSGYGCGYGPDDVLDRRSGGGFGDGRGYGYGYGYVNGDGYSWRNGDGGRRPRAGRGDGDGGSAREW